MVITLLGENLAGGAAELSDAEGWTEDYSLTHPVLVDPEWGVGWNYMSGSLPSESLFAPGMEIKTVDGFGLTAADIEEYLPR